MIKRKGAANAVLELVSKGGEHLSLMKNDDRSSSNPKFEIRVCGLPTARRLAAVHPLGCGGHVKLS